MYFEEFFDSQCRLLRTPFQFHVPFSGPGAGDGAAEGSTAIARRPGASTEDEDRNDGQRLEKVDARRGSHFALQDSYQELEEVPLR